MKKIINLLLALVMLLSLTACGGNGDGIPTGESTETTINIESNITGTEGSTGNTEETESTESIEETTGAETTNPSTTTPPTTQPPHTHNYNSKVTTAATCEKDGVKIFSCSCGDSYTEKIPATGQHTWSSATCTAPKTCNTCNATEGSALGHNYNSTVTTAATCGKDGVKTFTCSCGHSYTEKIAATGQHSYNKAVTSATCTAQGYTTYTCSCGDTYKDNYTEPKHSYQNYKCSICGIIEENHGVAYLKNWLLKNGNVYGERATITWYNDSNWQFSIGYNTSSDDVHFSLFYTDNDGEDVYTAVYLYDNKSNYDIYSTYGTNKPYLCEAVSIINPKTFTSNSPIQCQSFKGQYRDWFIENTRLSVNLVIAWAGDYLDYLNAGVSLADLGFKAY